MRWKEKLGCETTSDIGPQWRVSETITPERRITMARTDATGVMIRAADSAISAEWTAHVDHPAQLHSAVKLTLGYALSFEGKFLLHASGVLRRGKLWLFSGASGAGKSTIAEQLNDGGAVFSTDQAVLGLSAAGIATADPTPLSDFDGLCRITAPAPIAALVFIEQAEAHSLRRLSEHELGVRLLRNALFIPGATDRTEKLLAGVAQIASSAPGYLLKFKKDIGFWPLLDRCRIEKQGEMP